MRSHILLVGTIALLAPTSVTAQLTPSTQARFNLETWEDRSPHEEGSVHLNGVRIDYLDWGGSGPAILLVPGGDLSAHIFDQLAPLFQKRFRVLALSPRGQGTSETPVDGYTVSQEAADISALLDSLHITTVHLVGHSIAGATITRFAAEYPDRTDSLIYFDGLNSPEGAREMLAANPVPRPQPQGDFLAYRDWLAKYFYGTWNDALQADLVAQAIGSSQPNGGQRAAIQDSLDQDVIRTRDSYSTIAAPILAFWPKKTVTSHYPWLNDSPEAARAAADYLQTVRLSWEQKGVTKLLAESVDARVITFAGHHYFFVMEPEMVVSEMTSFLERVTSNSKRN